MKKIKILLTLDKGMKRILLETYINLARAKLLKSRSFSKVAPLLGERMKETPETFEDKDKLILSKISQSIQIMSKYTFWESECLVKAIAAMNMLEKRGINSTLYLGTAKDKEGKLVAHAWLRSGPFYITGFEVMEQFTVVSKFAKFV